MVFNITLDNDADGAGYLPGSSIKGSIYFDITKQSKGDLIASLQGQEFSRVRYTRIVKRGDHTVTETHHAEAYRNLVQLMIPIQAASNTMFTPEKIINPGSYVIPFDVQLPAGLPQSMECSSGTSRCAVRYSIKAQVKGSGWFQDYTCSTSITVRGEPVDGRDPVPYRGPPSQENVNFCCWNRGYMLFGAYVSDTLLHPGEQVRVNMSCRNRTTVPIQSVQANMVQHVTWNAGSHTATSVSTLASQSFGIFPGLERIASLSLNKNPSNNFLNNDLQDVARDLEEAKYSASMQLPLQQTLSTYGGSLIRVLHTLEITVKTGSCITDPTIVVPIFSGPSSGNLNGHFNTTNPPLQSATPSESEAFDFAAATTADMLYVSSTGAHLGGAAENMGDNPANDLDIVLEPYATHSSTANPSSPSMEVLLREMKESIQDYVLIQDKMRLEEWSSFFASLSSNDYGAIIQSVDVEFDQSKVAMELAKFHSQFLCEHIVAAVNKCSDWNKASLVEKLLPYTTDLVENKDKILNELSDWDKTVTERAFRNALAGKS